MPCEMRSKRYLPCLLLFVGSLGFLHFSGTNAEQRSFIPQAERTELVIPIAVYILDSDGGNNRLSSRRSDHSFASHFARVNEIWRQANIVIEPVLVDRLEVPRELLWGLAHRTGRGGVRDFFRGLRRGQFEIGAKNEKAVVWAFFVRSMGGVNGLAPGGSRTFFVADNPTVNDARVTSHELGHVLGLYHASFDSNRLLFSGTNGIVLTDEEQRVARYNARRLIE